MNLLQVTISFHDLKWTKISWSILPAMLLSIASLHYLSNYAFVIVVEVTIAIIIIVVCKLMITRKMSKRQFVNDVKELAYLHNYCWSLKFVKLLII